MELPNITYRNDIIDDRETFDGLPNELKMFYSSCNGCIALNGAIQIKGCTRSPKWISLYDIWLGNKSLSATYDDVNKSDIPIAQDAFGDQFLYRNGQIMQLCAETGEIIDLDCDLKTFLNRIRSNSHDYLSLQQIKQLNEMGLTIANGQLFNVFPPFIFDSQTERSYKPISAMEQIEFLKDLYKQTKDLEEGQSIELTIRE